MTEINTTNIITLLPLIKKFRAKFLLGDKQKYSWQYKFKGAEDVSYMPPPCFCPDKYSCKTHERSPLSDNDLLEHFSGKASEFSGGHKSGLAVVPLVDNRFKFFVVDSDNQESTYRLNFKLIPILKKYGIDYVYEVGSKDYKCHIWFLVDCSRETLQDFTYQLFREAEIDFDGEDRELQLEVYPTNKPNSLIRIPGGVHLRNNEINPIVYNGVTTSNVEVILETFINLKQYSEEEIRKWIKPIDTPIVPHKELFGMRNGLALSLIPRDDLDISFNGEEVPENAKNLVGNCQAINHLLREVIEKGLFNKRGAGIHNAGLYLAGALGKVDQIMNDEKGTCRNWIMGIIDKYRNRTAESHKWFTSLGKKVSSRTAGCNTWSRDVGKCKGCPFSGEVTSPKYLIKDSNFIIPEKIADVKLRTLEEVRKTTFKEVEERIDFYLENGIRKDMLLASAQSMGKSFLIDTIAAKLAKQGKTILIAVPTAKLALEHRDRLIEFGHKPFLLLSHTNIFKKDKGKRRFKIDFDCPEQSSIDECIKVGIPASQYRKLYCGKCPLREECPYPTQYVKAETESNILIIQHAHFSAKETMSNLLSKRKFDMLIIDEEFIDSLIKECKVPETELVLLSSFIEKYSWIKRLVEWFKEDYSEEFKPIAIKKDELDDLNKAFSEKLLPWNVPDYISFYNSKNIYKKSTGLILFSPLPNIPLRIFTDATPPVEILEIITNTKLEIYGQDEILDYRSLNPGNRIYQSLELSSSKTSLDAFNRAEFYVRLDGIASIIKTRYSDVQTLIVTYSGDHAEKVKTFFRINYPDLKKVTVSHMAIGTNEFENCIAMFQIAGLHYNSKQLALATYKIKCVENYWRRMGREDEIDNPYPYDYKENTEIDLMIEPVIRVEIGKEGPGLYQYPFPKFRVFRPTNKYFYYLYLLSLAKRQQAMRLRFNDGRERHAYIYDAGSRGTLLVNSF